MLLDRLVSALVFILFKLDRRGRDFYVSGWWLCIAPSDLVTTSDKQLQPGKLYIHLRCTSTSLFRAVGIRPLSHICESEPHCRELVSFSSAGPLSSDTIILESRPWCSFMRLPGHTDNPKPRIRLIPSPLPFSCTTSPFLLSSSHASLLSSSASKCTCQSAHFTCNERNIHLCPV